VQTEVFGFNFQGSGGGFVAMILTARQLIVCDKAGGVGVFLRRPRATELLKVRKLTLQLPRLDGSASDSSLVAEHSGESRRRVLVVDDNRDCAEMLCEVLQAYGCVTRVAHDGPAALEAAACFKPEVALVDISLPRMDGYELARRLRQLPALREIKLIAVTGYSECADRRRSEQAGFDRHLVKPVDLEELRRLVNR
jgi:CheY-like chemotaxis protein